VEAVAMKQSAGTLLYRQHDDRLEVLLVHPSGPYNRGKPWGIPKGVPDADEALEDAARRETREETGVVMTGPLVEIGFIDYTRTRKRVHCFAGPAPADAVPTTASWEVDRAEFVALDQARSLIHPEQAPFLDRLLALLGQAKE
jgi:predicted NUDIX family NTP pyrophosphohydrolase